MKPALTALLALALLGPALAQDPDAKAVEAEARAKVDALKASAKGKDNDATLSAIADCGSTPHVLTAAALAPILANPSDELALAAASALARMTGSADAAKALHSGLKPNEERSKVLGAVFDGIGTVGHYSSIAVCSAWINDRLSKRDALDQSGINAAFDAMGGLKFKSTVTTIIDLMKKNEVANGWRGGKGMRGRSEIRARAALQRLTGESWEMSDEWSDWWKKNQAKFNEDLSAK